MSKLSTAIKTKFATLEFDGAWEFSQAGYELYSHNYHRYPAKFTSPLARKLIEQESKEGDLVCDVFGGCGTTLLEAKLLGRKSVGYDINPVAKLITEVKNKAIKPEKLNDSYLRLNELIGSNRTTQDDYESTHERIQYWFSKRNYLLLSHIYESILAEENQDIQKFFLCAFSHCLKNGSRWLMKSIKPTIDKKKSYMDIVKLFARHTRGMVRKNELLYCQLKKDKRLSINSKIYQRDITKPDIDLKVDLVVTSPPYVTSYEYGDLHQLTLLWFGYKKYKGWQKHLNNFSYFRSQFIGSSIKRTDVNGDDVNSEIASNIVDNLWRKNKFKAQKVQMYFTRMNQSFQVIYDLLNNGRKACIVMGNTKLLGVPILNAQSALEQLLNIGFNRNYEVIKRDANTGKVIAPYRNKNTGKFVSKRTANKTIAYHEEYILKVKK